MYNKPIGFRWNPIRVEILTSLTQTFKILHYKYTLVRANVTAIRRSVCQLLHVGVDDYDSCQCYDGDDDDDDDDDADADEVEK